MKIFLAQNWRLIVIPVIVVVAVVAVVLLLESGDLEAGFQYPI